MKMEGVIEIGIRSDIFSENDPVGIGHVHRVDPCLERQRRIHPRGLLNPDIGVSSSKKNRPRILCKRSLCIAEQGC